MWTNDDVSGIQSGTGMKLGAFPFTGKSDTENTNNPLNTSELLHLKLSN
jgi:hypothetical protein